MANKRHTSIRVESEVMDAIERARSKRYGNVSANTWIIEAVMEKLKRDGIAVEYAEDA